MQGKTTRSGQDSGISVPVPPSIPEHVLECLIGTGAYGDVWRARTVTGTWRAVKVIHRARFENARTFEREYSALKRVEPISRSHESLVDILQIGRNDSAPEGGYFYYVMELADDAAALSEASVGTAGSEVPGGPVPMYAPRTLATVLKSQNRVAMADCIRFGAAIADGLADLHSHGLVHRDIKPANLIFVHGRLKLADIGLVAQLEDARTFVGTGGYIPPEGPGSPQADLYALGKVLYEMATGFDRMEYPKLPAEFRELSVGSHGAEYAELNAIILRACSPEPMDRHASAVALRGELLLIQTGQSVRKLRQHERLITHWRRLAIATSFVGLLGLILLAWQRRQTTAANERAFAEAQQRHAIEVRELAARQNLYAVDMNLAQVAMDAGNFGRAEALLTAYMPPGDSSDTRVEGDLRGFEWYHYWHRIQGDNAGILRGHTEVVSGLTLSRDGTRLYSCSHDGSVREWSLAEKRALRRWELPGGRFMAMSLDPSGERIALEGGNPALSAALDLKTGSWITNISTPSRSISWTPDGNGLLRGTRNFIYETNAAIEWTDARFQTRRELPEAGGCLAVSPDGTRFVTGPWGHSINLWSWPELKRLHQESDVGAAHALAFSADGKWFAAGTREGRLLLWDASLRTRQAAIQTHGNGVIWSLAFSPDGTRLATAGNDQTVRTWTLPGLTPEHVYRGHRSEVWAVRWSSDGQQLISGSKDTTIRFWEARRASTRQRLTNLIQAPHFSKDEQFIALRHRNNEASIHDVATLQTCLRLGDVGELGGFSGTPESIAVLTPDSVLERHSLKDGKVVESRRLAFPPKGLTKRLLSQAGHWLICGLNNGKLLVQNTTNGTPPITLEGHTAGITALEVSQNEEWLVSGSIDQSARLWDLKTLTLKHVYSKHRMGVGDVTFSPDTTRLATGSWDDSVHLWDMNDHRELALLDGHEGGVQAVAQTADARTIGVLSGLGVLKFWNVAVRRETGHIQLGVGPHQGWLSTSASGRWIAAVDAAGELTLLEAPKVFGRK